MLGSAPVSGADTTPISCPNGATIVLQGQAPPNEALLAYLKKRSVGGGSSDRSGRYRIPLKLRERPGIYPVEVRLRSSGAVVGRYDCYVDVPLTNQPTLTPEIVVTAAPNQPPTTTPRASGGTARPTSTPTSRSATATSRTPTATSRTTTATSRTATAAGSPAATGTAGPSPTVNPVSVGDVEIFEIIQVSSSNPDEYLTLSSRTALDIDIEGWQVINITRADRPTYTFPSYILEGNTVLDLYTGAGVNDVGSAIFYWNRSDTVWRTGDVAELRDSNNRLIFTYTVINT